MNVERSRTRPGLSAGRGSAGVRTGLLPLREEISPRVYALASVSLVIVTLVAWILVTQSGLVDPIFLPGPKAICEAAVHMITDGTLWTDTLASIYRIMVGWAISTLVAVPLGLLIGNFRFFEALFDVPIALTRYMPVVALIPLTILWVGVGDSQKFVIIFLGTFVQEVLMIADNVKSVPKDLINVAYTFGYSKWEVLWRVVLPYSLPGIFDTFRLTIGWAWTYLVVAELVAANTGLGYRIMAAQRYLATDVIILGIVVIGILGMITDLSLKFVYRRVFPWMKERD
ncbi:MAG: ABC transporter permease [Limnochordia bacterium]